MPRVSVIIPCYNVEQYLPECLDSILNQTLKDLEIILINDGSTDGSGQIIDSYAQADPRFIIVHQKNMGVSAARNKGLTLASAPYILFIDSDDWIEAEMIKALYQKAERTSADIVVCNYHEELFGKTNTDVLNLNEEEIILEEIGLSHYYFQQLTDQSHGGYVWNKLYKSKKIFQSGLNFSPSITSAQDILFNLCLFLHVRKIAVLSKSFYHYRQRQGSKVNTMPPDIIIRRVNLVEILIEYSRQQGKDHFLIGFFPHLLYQFLSMEIQYAIENNIQTSFILRLLQKATEKKEFLPLMKQLTQMQLLKKRLPGGPKGISISRSSRIGLFALLALGKKHRVLIFLSRMWLRYRRFQKPENQKPRNLFPSI